ncbi:hypothetical protein ASE74_16395 [Pedobacter sp. Leaf216]|uniref:potassium channel family protein n=1 Tax=Pedobacter sp. Leaf216 TaxID=1735684 RepID=UPI0006FEC940|nr:potassium channel family protein [Pedobacter sp. Leaf216]KQM77969.1 hypothetical protein ASE74_16395 [Pedobacter sp. Leaf216]
MKSTQNTLPKKRKHSFVEWIDSQGAASLAVLGILSYSAMVLVFSLLEKIILSPSDFNQPLLRDWNDLIYFNFISILTIGYGDIAPKGNFRWFVILEAVLGLGVYSSFISIITIKILLPKKDTIVFSRFAYFCTNENAFMIIYLNTAKKVITSLETSWYFKLGEDWTTCQPAKVPFITTSVQTFYLRFGKSLEEISAKLHPLDCLRVGLTGSLGMSNYSTSIQYNLSEIIIIPDRKELSKYPGFYSVDDSLGSEKFIAMFHYEPDGAPRLSTYAN